MIVFGAGNDTWVARGAYRPKTPGPPTHTLAPLWRLAVFVKPLGRNDL
jgi:hypothetical protein